MLSHLGRLQERLKYWQRLGEAADVVFIQPPPPPSTPTLSQQGALNVDAEERRG